MRVQDIIAEKEIDEAPAGMFKQMGRKIGAKALGAVGAKGKAAELGGAAEVGDEANELKTAFRGYLGKTGGNAKQVEGPQLAAFLKSKGYPNMHLKDVQGVMTPKQVDAAIMQAAQDAAKADGDPGATAKTAPAAGAASQKTSTAAFNYAGTSNAPIDIKQGIPKTAKFQDANGELWAYNEKQKVWGSESDKTIPAEKGVQIYNKTSKDKRDFMIADAPTGADDAASTAANKVEFTPDQPVMFVDKNGQEKQATVVGKSEDGDENKVSVKGAKGQTFNIPRTSLKDPKTKKPFAPGAATKAAPAAGGLEIPAEMQKKIDALNPEQKKELASLL